MYTLVNPIEETIELADKHVISNDRMLMADMFRIIEEFCAANNFMILSPDMLLGRPLNRDSFVYDVYFFGGFDAAKLMANALFAAKVPHFKINTLSLKTIIKDREMIISINMRIFLRMFAINDKHVDSLSIMRPGQFAKSVAVRCVGPIVPMINIYAQMYNYEMYKKWNDLLDTEKQLFTHFEESMIIVGANDNIISNDDTDNIIDGGARIEGISGKIVKLIMRNLDKFDMIVVGDRAWDNHDSGRLQVLSARDVDDIMAFIKNKEPNCEITIVESQFVFDFRLRKYTFKCDGADLFDLFNSPSYEMMNYDIVEIDDVRSMKIGGGFVLARFALIQCFIFAIVLRLPIRGPLAQFARARQSALRRVIENPQELFSKDRICGTAIGEKVSKKKIAENMPIFPIYYPAIALSRHGGNNSAIIARIAGPVQFDPRDKTLLGIAQRITRDFRHDINEILSTYYRANMDMWSAQDYSKNANRYKDIIELCPPHPNIYVDIGCGDGRDFRIMAAALHAKRAIACDIEDLRKTDNIAPNEEFMLINEDVALSLSNGVVNVCTCFHSIHHARDAIFRLRDIARIMADNGILIIKDHNVVNDRDAQIISFEHFVYSVGEGAITARDGAKYGEIVPMWYYSSEQLRQFICDLGFEELYYNEETRIMRQNGRTEIVPKETRVYIAAFRHHVRKNGGMLYKGFDTW